MSQRLCLTPPEAGHSLIVCSPLSRDTGVWLREFLAALARGDQRGVDGFCRQIRCALLQLFSVSI